MPKVQGSAEPRFVRDADPELHVCPATSPPRSAAINLNCSSAASRSSTISCAMTSGGGKLSESASASSRSQKTSRLDLSRAVSSS
jgi:hypothetical protein